MPAKAPDSKVTLEGDFTFRAELIAAAAADAMLLAVAMTDPLREFMPEINPFIAWAPAPLRFMPENADRIPDAVDLAIATALAPPLLMAATNAAICEVATATI
jgi:hypothetical protein